MWVQVLLPPVCYREVGVLSQRTSWVASISRSQYKGIDLCRFSWLDACLPKVKVKNSKII